MTRIPVLGRKLDYLLGIATGSAHNVVRSRIMASALNKIGIYDNEFIRQYLAEHLTQVLNNNLNIISRERGTETRESLFTGPKGAVKLETVWQGDKLITVVVKEGARS